jgi:hypothetical protein
VCGARKSSFILGVIAMAKEMGGKVLQVLVMAREMEGQAPQNNLEEN